MVVEQVAGAVRSRDTSDDGARILLAIAKSAAREPGELERALAPLGREIVVAAWGTCELASLSTQDFALIVLDVDASGRDAFDIARTIRAGERDTAILFVTTTTEQDDAVFDAHDLGSVDFMRRPLRPELLRAKASVFLEWVPRREAEAARTRASFLAIAGGILLESIVLEETFRNIANAAVATIADWCIVDLADGEGVRPVAISHVDPGKVELARELRRRSPPARDAKRGTMNVIRTGVAELYPQITADMLAESAPDEEQQRVRRSLDIRSAMLVPIRERQRTIGVITFVSAASDRRYTQDDLTMAVELGRRAGSAIVNAHLYEEAMQTAHLNEMFSGVVGHDLRNPLAAIVATTQLLLMRDGAPESVQPLQRIMASSHRMARMIDQLLDLTRIRAGGGLPADPEPMSFDRVAEEVIAELRVAHPDRAISFETRGDLDGVWDPDRIAQLLSNLLSNALVHGAPGTRVDLVADGTGADAIVATVTNEGAIPAALIPALFEAFRGTSPQRKRDAGLGLGLYIARQIALVHRGTLELVDAGAARTALRLTLPRGSSDRSYS